MRRSWRYRPGESGMALLLVVSVISLLTVIILQFNRSMSNNLSTAWQFKDREQLYGLADSGTALGLAALHTDSYSNEYDCLLDSWGLLSESPVSELAPGSELIVTIIDLSGRFQLNSLVSTIEEGQNGGTGDRLAPEEARAILKRLITSGDFVIEDEFQAQEIIDALIDWQDSDDDESAYGAESGYYESLDPPYKPRNNLLELPNEILAVKGITPELMFGNDEKKGLADYITVFGSGGKININTADGPLIRALDDRIAADDAQLLTEYRAEVENAETLSDVNWYRDVPGWPGDIELSSQGITTTSTVFRIEAEAVLNGEYMKMTTYVRRSDKNTLEILYRKTQ